MKNIFWQSSSVTKEQRATLLQQRPCCIWLTGLSGAGKSSIASGVDVALAQVGKHAYVLDGDNIRHGLNSDLGFSDQDRCENIRRVAEVARLFVDAGLIVIVAFISPFRSERESARRLFKPDEFFEVFVDASLDVCECRDVKGLYAKARAGEIKNLTGIDSPYEPPLNPELHIKTADFSLDECIQVVLKVVDTHA